MQLRHCHNFHDFRELARRRLPGPIFDYIDGGADDEVTLRQNTASLERCDLVPNILRGVESLDLSVTVMGQKAGHAGLLLSHRAPAAIPP
jgi:L-lactate dehydrogenase (cytochrome)